MKTGTIYFVRSGEAVKIGFTTDVEARMRVLRTDSPAETTLLAAMEGGRSDERRLHRDFKHLHIRGEWYRASDDLLAFIALVDAPPSTGGTPLPLLTFDRAAREALGL